MSHSASLPTSRMTVTNRRFLGGVFAFMLSATAVIHATPVTWSAGDVILGFESTSLNIDYLVDLGPGATFAASLKNGTFSPVNLNADLTNCFGAGWYTNTTASVQWGLFGLPSNKSIVYASVPQGGPAIVKKAANLLSTASTRYGSLGGQYNVDIMAVPTQGLNVGVEQFVGGADALSVTWTGNTPSSTPFGNYNHTIENGVAGNLDIYGTTGILSTLEGTLSLSSLGSLTIADVPEPTTYALFGMASFFLLIAYRRRRVGSMN